VAGFRLVSETERWRGHVVSVAEVDLEGPAGERVSREVVRHPGAVGVVAVDGEGRALLVRQYRVAVDDFLLEIPAGKRDRRGEAPEETATRELEEETGVRAGRLRLLARFHTSPGFCDEAILVYLATDLSAGVARPHGLEEGQMAVSRLPLAEVPGLVRSGEIRDAKTIVGLYLAAELLGDG
jgi:8-oxo-dGTP pyrophosphatase MutT (NUDIX family)